MPRLAPGLSQTPGLQLPPIPALRTSFVETVPLRKNGTNQNVIARAVRNLASRIFPRKAPEQKSQTAFTLIDRPFAGKDFHVTAGQGGVAKDIR